MLGDHDPVVAAPAVHIPGEHRLDAAEEKDDEKDDDDDDQCPYPDVHGWSSRLVAITSSMVWNRCAYVDPALTRW